MSAPITIDSISASSAIPATLDNRNFDTEYPKTNSNNAIK